MKTTISAIGQTNINWVLLLDSHIVRDWANKKIETSKVRETLTGEIKIEFDNIIRSRGTDEGRRLARKAIRYRGL